MTRLNLLAALLLGAAAFSTPGPAPAEEPAASGLATFSAPYTEGEAVLPGCLLVHDAVAGTRQIAVDDLRPKHIYEVRVVCYADPAGTQPGPLSPDAKVVTEQSLSLIAGFPGQFSNTRTRGAFHPQHTHTYIHETLGTMGLPQLPEPKIEPVVKSSQILIFDAQTPAAMREGIIFPAQGRYAPPPQLISRRDRLVFEASDTVQCGDLTLKVYEPGANRIEVFVREYQSTAELNYIPGQALPELVQRQSQPTVHGWTACSLHAPDLGYMFEDGSPMPTDAETEQLVHQMSTAMEQYRARQEEAAATADDGQG